jgi:hypothetical protein
MNTTTSKETSVKMQLQDIILDVTWSKISRRYFDRSASWIYNKLNGVDGNGGQGDFTYAEKLQLQNALYDFADRIRNVAKEIA